MNPFFRGVYWSPNSFQIFKMSSDLVTLIALGEDPKTLLIARIKTFINMVEFSSGEHMKKHAAVCFFGFYCKYSDLIKEHFPSSFLRVCCEKAEEFIRNTKNDTSPVGVELYGLCIEFLQLFQDPPMTPPPSSNAATCPGAPSRPVTATLLATHEQEGEPVARQLFPASSSNAAPAPQEQEPMETKRGQIYRAVSKEGKRSSVKCLSDNGPLLEIRFDDKTGFKLINFGQRIFANYEDWQEELQWM